MWHSQKKDFASLVKTTSSYHNKHCVRVSRIQYRTKSAKDKLEKHSQERPTKTGLTWKEVKVNVDLYSASLWTHLRNGMHSQGISVLPAQLALVR